MLVYNYEGGGVSFNSGVSRKLIDKEKGLFDHNDVINQSIHQIFITVQKQV